LSGEESDFWTWFEWPESFVGSSLTHEILALPFEKKSFLTECNFIKAFERINQAKSEN